jgi:GNAT superfamily N-acetyltransferase
MLEGFNIRRATKDDLRQFTFLWKEYLLELQTLGGAIWPSHRTLRFYREMVRIYDSDPLLGVCLIGWEGKKPAGVVLWGTLAPMPIDTDHGRVAQGHGTYVRPDFRGRGLSSELRTAAKTILKANGFDTVIGAAEIDNKTGLATGMGAGFEIVQQVGVLSLKEKG